MKKIEFTPRLLLSSVILLLGVLLAFVPKNTTTPYKLTAVQILEEIKAGTQYLGPDEVAQMVVEKDPSLQLIDVRPKDEFEKFSLPGAINIPLDNLLALEFADVFNQNVMMNVLYANGSTKANEAWMLLRQLGVDNIYVLQGGLNYWAETIMNPQAPSSTSSDDELAKYDFRRGANNALGGGSVETSQKTGTSTGSAPKPKPAGKKQKIAGGCS